MNARRHCLKYVSWDHIEHWKARLRGASGGDAALYPYAYGTRDEAFSDSVGTVLWLLTLPRYDGYRLAPSIVARLEIEKVLRRETDADELMNLDPEVLKSGPIVVIADKSKSYYLPLNNAFHIMMELRFQGDAPRLAESYARRDRTREEKSGPYVSLAAHFQRHRWLDEHSVEPLEQFAASVRAGRRVFLSYRRADFPMEVDGTASWPEALGAALRRRKVSCWWDRWYLPQSDEYHNVMPQALLQALLDDAVMQAAWFVALVGPRYLRADDQSWPRQEWLQAREQLGRNDRRHPMNRVVVFFSEQVDDQMHRRWQDAGERVLWVGPDPTPDRVAEELEKFISLEVARHLAQSI